MKYSDIKDFSEHLNKKIQADAKTLTKSLSEKCFSEKEALKGEIKAKNDQQKKEMVDFLTEKYKRRCV